MLETWSDERLQQGLLILLVTQSLSEDSDLLVKQYEEFTNHKEVERKTTVLTPHVAVIGKVTDPSSKLFLVIDKTVVNSCIDSMLDGLIMAFSAYYVFNIRYEEGLTSTLEFIQRCIVNLNPCSGSKSKKKTNNKVLSFLNSLNDFEWSL